MRESDKQFSLCTVHSEEFLTHRRCALHSSGPALNGVESSSSAFLVCSAPRPAVSFSTCWFFVTGGTCAASFCAVRGQAAPPPLSPGLDFDLDVGHEPGLWRLESRLRVLLGVRLWAHL